MDDASTLLRDLARAGLSDDLLDRVEAMIRPKRKAAIRAERVSTWPADAFERWYRAYPRKVGRGQAEKAFRACEAREDIGFDALMSATQRFARSCLGRDPEFIPHPATWLNGKRYDDDDRPSPHYAEPPRKPSGPDAAFVARCAEKLRQSDQGGWPGSAGQASPRQPAQVHAGTYPRDRGRDLFAGR